MRHGKGIKVEVDAALVTKKRQVCMSACHLRDQRMTLLPKSGIDSSLNAWRTGRHQRTPCPCFCTHTHTHTHTEGHRQASLHTCFARGRPGTQASQLCICSERTLRCQLFCTSSAIASKGRSAGTTTSPSSSTSSSLPIEPVLLPLLPVTHHAAG